MVQKRVSRDQEGDGDFAVPRPDSKRRSLFSVVEDLTRGSPFNEHILESCLRRVVREELERKLPFLNASSSSHSAAHQAGPPGGGTGLELRFYGRIPPTLFTGSKIEPEDPNSVLTVVLFDTLSQAVVRTGPLSSMKVQIVALNSEFGGDDDRDNWSQKQFDDSVQREREGRRPLLAGDLTVSLVAGVGEVGNVFFTDNSSWTRSRKFRLGARKAPAGGERVREATTTAFVVKDHRGELYKKHHPPYLNDEVWRLEKIAKDGVFHKRLAEYGIATVTDFLRLYARDPNGLREILGKISKRAWNAIVGHAKDCVIDDNKLYAYHRNELNTTVFFDSVYRVVQAHFGNQSFSADQFNSCQTALVDNLKQQAYSNVNDLVPMDGSEWPMTHQPSIDPNLNYQTDYQAVQQAQPDLSHQLVVPSSLPDNNPQIVFPLGHINSFSYEGLLSTQNYHSLEPPGYCAGESSQMPFNFNPEGLFQSPWRDPGTTGIFPVIGKARWCKVRAAVKCWLSVKEVATKKMSRPMYLSC